MSPRQHQPHRDRRWLAACGLLLLLAGCAQPAWRQTLTPDLQETVETGVGFRHRLLFKPGRGDELHIYLHGDGSLWRTPQELFPDPTPAAPLALELLQRDPAPALLLGRPCYFQTDDPRCAPRWWTSARYSAEIVDSLLAVAQRRGANYRRVVLIGHSGGGALAVLMASRLPGTSAVITIAGNLDVESWVKHHHYGVAVAGESLDPNRQPPLPTSIAQWHYAGGDDDTVRWQWIEAFSARQHGARFIRLEGFDHRCCWAQRWSELLLRTAVKQADAGAD